MTTSEPANTEWVAVQLPTGAVRAFQRLDHLDQGGRRWFMDGRPDHLGETVSTWRDLCRLGPIAYVGAFADRT